jgi:hypothetical protein
MPTARDLITNALVKARVYAPGEQVLDADIAQGFVILNQMTDQWSNEALMTYAILEQSGTLIPGQYQYTIGAGGNFNMTRPLRILNSPGTCYILDNNGNRYNLEVVPRDRWNLIGNINQVTANFPNTLFYDPQFPLGVINLYPIPNIGWTLFFDSYLQLTDFGSLSTALSLPPGYEKAIIDCLTIELVPYFKEDTFQVPPLWMKQAMTSKGIIKRTNIRENIADYDSELISRANGSYNIYLDSSRRGGVS